MQKSRTAYILLGLFLGGLGIHNFYAGYIGKGIAQLLVTLFLWWLFFPVIAVIIWSVLEAILITKSADGKDFI